MQVITNTIQGPFRKNRLIAMVESSTAGVAITENADGKVSYANKKAVSILGKDIYKILSDRPGRLSLYRSDGTHYKAEETPTSRSLRTGEEITGEEMMFIDRHGIKTCISINTSPVFSRDGEVEAVISNFEDITLRKEMENELKNDAFLLDNVNDAVMVIDGNYIITYWNKGAERIYGWSSEEATGRSSSELLQTRFIGLDPEEAILKAAEKGENEADVIQKHKAGNDLYVHTIYRVLKDDKGGITKFIAVNRDISEKFKAELALRESEKKFSIIFHQNPAPIFITSVDGQVIDVNESFVKLSGYSRKELLSKDFNSRMFYSSTAEREQLVLIALKQGKLHNLEFTGTGKNGIKKHLIASTDLISINDKQYFLSTMLDMTAVKEAEDALRESEAKLKQANEYLEVKVEERTAQLSKTMHKLDSERKRLNNVLNMIPAYVVVFTKDHTIAFYNQSYVNEFGPVDKRGGNDFHENERRCENCKIEKVFKSKRPNYWEWNAPNGKTYEVTDFPFRDTEGNELVLEMGVDITEKKNVDRYVLQKVLETEEEGKRKFASDLHDDLGPTLSATKLQLSLLDSELTTASQRDILRFCDALLSESIQKMRTIANSILPHVLESYGLECAAETFLAKVTSDSSMTFSINSNLDDVRFDKETELHLYRIITELITNTIRHSGADKIYLDLNLKNAVFEMKYSDNGKGYKFVPDRAKLSGIGLQNIVNRVRLINGNIKPQIKDGKTTVRIIVPVG